MKLGFIYVPLVALLYNSSALCSAVDFEDEDFKRAVQLSLEESDRQLAKKLSSEEDELEAAINLSLIPTSYNNRRKLPIRGTVFWKKSTK